MPQLLLTLSELQCGCILIEGGYYCASARVQYIRRHIADTMQHKPEGLALYCEPGLRNLLYTHGQATNYIMKLTRVFCSSYCFVQYVTKYQTNCFKCTVGNLLNTNLDAWLAYLTSLHP